MSVVIVVLVILAGSGFTVHALAARQAAPAAPASQASTPAASSGFNSATVTLANTGLCLLHISDNFKTSGTVTVRVQLASGGTSTTTGT